MAEEKLTCTRCGDEITPGFEYGTEERPLCEECYCDMTAVCPVCDEHFTPPSPVNKKKRKAKTKAQKQSRKKNRKH